jgi:hypothetical protein
MQRVTRSQHASDAATASKELNDQREATALKIIKTLNAAEIKAKQITAQNRPAILLNKESGRKRGHNCEYKVSGTAVYEFKQLGFDQYLERAALKDSTVESVIKMFSQFITYVKESYRKQVQEMTTKQILHWVMDRSRNLFSSYGDTLTTKSSNKRKRIEAIRHAVSFLNVIHTDTARHDYADALSALDQLRKQYTQAARVEERAPTKGVQHLMSINAYPRGGLAEIKANLDQGWEYFDALVAKAQADGHLSEERYLECLRYVLATLWGYDENARSVAIERVCVDDVTLALEHHDFVLSQHFKTYGQYQYQTVKFSEIIKKVWIPIIRPIVAKKTQCQNVFLGYSGNPLPRNSASRHVQKYHHRYGGNYSVTTMRKTFEATYSEAEAAGVISSEAHASLTKAQGHSAQTAKRYYDIVGKDAALEIVSALENTSHYKTVCDSLPPYVDGADEDFDLASKVDAIVSRQSSLEGVLDWGSFGACYSGKSNAHGKRFEWTPEEIEWLKNWFAANPADMPNRYAACLQALREAPCSVKGMFHPNHVSNSDRLKTGAQRAEILLGRIYK